METESEIGMMGLMDIPGGCEFETEHFEVMIGDDFEFSFDCKSFPASPVSADVVFFDWKMIASSGNIQETEDLPTTEIVVDSDEDLNVIRSASRSLWELMNVENELRALSSSISTHSSSPDVVNDEVKSSLIAEEQSQSFCEWNPTIAGRMRKSKRWSKRWSMFHDLFS